MQPAGDFEAFLDDPIGKYVTGDNWLYFYASPHFSGFVLWGRLTAVEIAQTTRITPDVHRKARRPHVALIDSRRVEQADNSVFAVTADYVRSHHAALKKAIEKLAIVHGPGLIATIAAGFFRIVEQPYEVELFTDPAAAVEWLGVEDGLALLAEVDGLQAASAGIAPLVRDLRAHLDERIGELTLPIAARALGLSDRSLQRRLAEHATSFQKEVAAARVRRAQHLLAETNASITQIAFDVGCSSLPHFSRLFRKETGETPAEWRARRRGPAKATDD